MYFIDFISIFRGETHTHISIKNKHADYTTSMIIIDFWEQHIIFAKYQISW